MKTTVMMSLPTFALASLAIPAMAADTAKESRSGNIEEVIVSSQRREERLLETPISVGVLSGADLDRSSARGVVDVLNQVGGVSVTEAQPGLTSIAVRGVLSGAGVATTAYYMDELPFAFIRHSQLPDTNAFDLKRVEVLRGPQGTLYGANALSGVVRVLTNDARLDTFELKGRTRVSSTEDGGSNYGGDVAVNVPLVEGKLGVRAVASYSDLSGYINVAQNCFAPCLPGERKINDSQLQSYRVKVGYAPTDRLTFNLGLSRSDIHNGAPSQSQDDFTTRFSGNQPDDRVLDIYNLVGEYTWKNVSLLSSTGYLEYQPDTRNEIMVSATTPASVLTINPLQSFSQEVRLASRSPGPWQWTTGAIYKDTIEEQGQDARPLFPQIYRVNETSESYAVFGELTRSFADGKFDVTGGLRYFEEEIIATQFADFRPRPVAPQQVSDSDKVTGRLVLAYKPETDTMFYGSVATGFRSGINQSPAVMLSAPGFPAVKPDSLITYEIGTKGRVLTDTLTYDTAVYYTDWKDIQQSLIVPAGFSARLNAGKASGFGVDTSLTYQPLDTLSMYASVGWNDLTIGENVFQQNLVLFKKGARLNDSPEWTGSVGGNYSMDTPMAGVRAVMSTNFTYTSPLTRRFLSGSLLQETSSDPTKNLRASIGIEGDRWTFDVYGENLLNEFTAVTPANAGANNNSIRMRPRTVGVQVSVSY